jgi:hypothetical protein
LKRHPPEYYRGKKQAKLNKKREAEWDNRCVIGDTSPCLPYIPEQLRRNNQRLLSPLTRKVSPEEPSKKYSTSDDIEEERNPSISASSTRDPTTSITQNSTKAPPQNYNPGNPPSPTSHAPNSSNNSRTSTNSSVSCSVTSMPYLTSSINPKPKPYQNASVGK